MKLSPRRSFAAWSEIVRGTSLGSVLGLLPGGLLMLVISEGLRRADRSTRVTVWSLPWLAVAGLAAVAAPTFSTWDQWSWTLAWAGSALLFAVGTLLLRHPLGLYPTLVAGTVAFLAAGYLVQPTLAPARSYATLAALTWLFLGGAWLLDRVRRAPDGLGGRLWAMALSAMDPDGPRRLDTREAVLDARALLSHWSLPLHVMGWATAVLACLGSAPEAQAGLWAAGAVAVLVVVLTVLNGAPAYAWLGLAATLLAYEHGLRVARIDWAEQPPYWAGAALGLHLAIAPEGVTSFQFHRNKVGYYYIALGLVAVVTMLVWWLQRSPFGLILQALRDDEDAVKSLGFSPTRYKLAAMALSAAVVGAGGVFYAQYVLFIDPSSVLALSFSVVIALIPILGGVACWSWFGCQ